MDLTNSQKLTMQTWLLANATTLNDQEAADALNAIKSPAYLVYRRFVPMAEIMGNGWDWQRVDNLSQGKARIWDWMKETYAEGGVFGLDFANTECRVGVNTVWVGTQADLNVRNSVYGHSYKSASVAEHLFSTGAGIAPVNGGDGSGPGTIAENITGLVTAQNVVESYNAV